MELVNAMYYELLPNSSDCTTRKAMPLKASAAKTVHKSQGSSYTSVLLDLSAGRAFPHQVYVGLSRVTNINGLHLIGFEPKQIKVSQQVVAEMDRLRWLASYLCNQPSHTVSHLRKKPFNQCLPVVAELPQPKLIYVNVRSLPRNHTYLCGDPDIRGADVLMFSEARVTTLAESNLDIPEDQYVYHNHTLPRWKLKHWKIDNKRQFQRILQSLRNLTLRKNSIANHRSFVTLEFGIGNHLFLFCQSRHSQHLSLSEHRHSARISLQPAYSGQSIRLGKSTNRHRGWFQRRFFCGRRKRHSSTDRLDGRSQFRFC